MVVSFKSRTAFNHVWVILAPTGGEQAGGSVPMWERIDRARCRMRTKHTHVTDRVRKTQSVATMHWV